MKIEFNAHVENVVVTLCVLLLCLAIQQCNIQQSKAHAEIEKAHIAAGQCKDKWNAWTKCQ